MINPLRALSRQSLAKSHPGSVRRVGQTDAPNSAALEICRRELALDSLPNDLTRMLYLASLRDCNSGRYLHPQLSTRIGVEEADHVLSVCHGQIFRRLLIVPVSAYQLQLEEYIRYTRAERSVVLDTWQSLRAYRSTIPVHALPVYAELFYLNIELALTILNDPRTWSGEGS
jgi:hypothetical protein